MAAGTCLVGSNWIGTDIHEYVDQSTLTNWKASKWRGISYLTKGNLIAVCR